MDASQKLTGACLVCGKTCTLLCSACAQKSNIDLYFCSCEHQKLVPAKSPSLKFLETFYAFYKQLTAAGHDVVDDSRWYSEYCHRVSVQLALMILVTSATKQQVGGNDARQTADDKLVEAREANVVALRHFLEKVVNDPRLGGFARSGMRAAGKMLEMLRQLYGRKLV